MRNFMLISKMHTFVYLFCRFFELWPVLGRKRPVLGKTGIFGLLMAITQNPTGYFDFASLLRVYTDRKDGFKSIPMI